MAEPRTQRLTDELEETTEITLGTGKLLGIFFGLAVLCALFFSFGYMVGRGSASGSKTEIVGDLPGTGNQKGKPSAVDKNSQAGPQPCSAGSPGCGSASGATSVPVATPAPVATASTAASASADNSGGSYAVQVAAVTKREDADILVSALQKKQYQVFIATVTGDSLYHIQVGPFSDFKDAEAMRARLAADGYNAIVKRGNSN